MLKKLLFIYLLFFPIDYCFAMIPMCVCEAWPAIIPALMVSPSTTVCIGQPITLTSAIAHGGCGGSILCPARTYTFQVSNGGPFMTIMTTTSNSIVVIPATTGIFSYRVIWGCPGCPSSNPSSAVNVTVTDCSLAVTLSASVIPSPCPQPTVTLEAVFSGGTPPYVQAIINAGSQTLVITNPANPLLIPVTPDAVSYTVTVTDSAGGMATSNTVIT